MPRVQNQSGFEGNDLDGTGVTWVWEDRLGGLSQVIQCQARMPVAFEQVSSWLIAVRKGRRRSRPGRFVSQRGSRGSAVPAKRSKATLSKISDAFESETVGQLAFRYCSLQTLFQTAGIVVVANLAMTSATNLLAEQTEQVPPPDLRAW